MKATWHAVEVDWSPCLAATSIAPWARGPWPCPRLMVCSLSPGVKPSACASLCSSPVGSQPACHTSMNLQQLVAIMAMQSSSMDPQQQGNSSSMEVQQLGTTLAAQKQLCQAPVDVATAQGKRMRYCMEDQRQQHGAMGAKTTDVKVAALNGPMSLWKYRCCICWVQWSVCTVIHPWYCMA